jgi:hypothetical protein
VDGILAESARREARRYAWATAATLASALAALAALHALGHATRSFASPRPGARAPEVIVARSGRDALAAWRARGMQGRILVHAGRFLHFVADEGTESMRETGPGSGRAHDERLLERAGPRNYLRVAASTGIARRILYLSPPTALDARLADLHLDRGELPAALPSQAFPRELWSELPALEEPVLVEVSASWFDDPRAANFLASLDAAHLRADLVVVNLAEDAEDVSERARAAARKLAAALAARADGARP